MIYMYIDIHRSRQTIQSSGKVSGQNQEVAVTICPQVTLEQLCKCYPRSYVTRRKKDWKTIQKSISKRAQNWPSPYLDTPARLNLVENGPSSLKPCHQLYFSCRIPRPRLTTKLQIFRYKITLNSRHLYIKKKFRFKEQKIHRLFFLPYQRCELLKTF